jgi:hypothetical protein
MENTSKMLESLTRKASEYGTTTLKLIKLKALDKSSEAFSSLISWLIVSLFVISFIFFINLGLALWLGEIFGKSYVGFFIVATLNGFTAIFIRLFLRNWIKKLAGDNFIKQVLK